MEADITTLKNLLGCKVLIKILALSRVFWFSANVFISFSKELNETLRFFSFLFISAYLFLEVEALENN